MIVHTPLKLDICEHFNVETIKYGGIDICKYDGAENDGYKLTLNDTSESN